MGKESHLQPEEWGDYNIEHYVIQTPHGDVEEDIYFNKKTGQKEKLVFRNQSTKTLQTVECDPSNGHLKASMLYGPRGELVFRTQYEYGKDTGKLDRSLTYNAQGEQVGVDNFKGIRSAIEEQLRQEGRTKEADNIEDDYLLRIAERLGEEWNDIGSESH